MTGSIVIRGGRLLLDGSWVERDLAIVDGTIVDGTALGDHRDGAVFDVDGALVAPGLVDLQCNGAAGVDLRAEPERLWDTSAALPRWGVTAWLPTIVTSTPDVVIRAMETLRDGPPDGWTGAEPLGLHLEGPFLAPEAAGAHPIDLLRPPTMSAIDTWSRASGVAMVTLAPELAGALDVIGTLVERGVVVSIGHSMASAGEVDAAIEAGARSVTHLFNAMSPIHHRAPGVAGAALADDRLAVGLIADGIHVDPRMVRVAARASADRLVLVSDAVALLGMEGVDTSDGVRLSDGTLAGSVLPLVQAVQNLVDYARCTPAHALDAASRTPAALLDVRDRGSLHPGARGDAVVLDDQLGLVATVVGGEIVHDTRR